MLASSPQRIQLWPVIVAAGLALPLGVLAVRDPTLGIAATIAVFAAGLVFVDLAAGLCVFILLAYFEALPGFGSVSPARAVGVLMVVGWAGTVALRRRRTRAPASEGIALGWFAVLFLAWGCASVVWAEDVGRSVDSLTRFALLFSLLAVVPVAIRTERHAVAVIGALIAGALLSALYGVAKGINQGTERLSGAGINPNVLGLVLMSAIVLGVGLVAARRLRPEARVGAALAVAACTIGILLTGSRGALVGLAVAALVGVAFGGRARARLIPLLLFGAAVGVAYISLFAASSVRDRIMDPGGSSGRADLWRVGWRMIEDKPFSGVGLGNFREVSVDYLLQPGPITDPNAVVTKPRVPHNIYVEVTAELGVIGLLLFVALLIALLRCAVVAAKRFERSGQRDLEALSRALFAAMCGLLAAGAFSSQTYNKVLWTILALAPAMLALSRLGPRPVDTTPRT